MLKVSEHTLENKERQFLRRRRAQDKELAAKDRQLEKMDSELEKGGSWRRWTGSCKS